MAGKGDRDRTADRAAFRDRYDLIDWSDDGREEKPRERLEPIPGTAFGFQVVTSERIPRDTIRLVGRPAPGIPLLPR